MRRIKLIPFLLLLLFQLLLTSAVQAQVVPDPDQLFVPEITGYEGVLEPLDVLVIVEYDIVYALLPTDAASETFLGRFMDSTGLVELQSVSPFPFNDLGYNRGILSFYFTPSQVTALGVTFDGTHVIRLQGNPSVFPSPPTVLTSNISWRNNIATEFNLEQDVIDFAQSLEVNGWSSNGFDLISGGSQGNRLTSVGSEYFTNAIPNLSLMATDVFSVSLVETNPGDFRRDFSGDYLEELRDFWDGTPLAENLDSLAVTMFGNLPGATTLLTTAIMIVIAGAVGALALKQTGRTDFGLLIMGFVFMGGALIGFTEPIVAWLLGVAGVGLAGWEMKNSL